MCIFSNNLWLKGYLLPSDQKYSAMDENETAQRELKIRLRSKKLKF